MNSNKYTPIIGLEVHVELKTNSKMFCSCSADYFGQKPNSHTCPVCLGLPGALPIPNQQAINWCIMIAQALNCEINLFSKFDRKNYFYPDLAKGFQISQYDLPFGKNGYVKLKNNKVRIRRVHMEEDTGKLIHQDVNGKSVSLIDFNRSGVPLVEIVTEPDFNDASDVMEYLKKLQTIVRYLEVSNADMEKGNMRLEPNISLQLKGEDELPKYKVEVKNINSFSFVDKAIKFEIKRQQEILASDKTPLQETRGWNEFKNATISQRVKEDANDYRYFPEPDIPPVIYSKNQVDQLKNSLPELQEAKQVRFVRDYGLTDYDAKILTREKKLAEYFEQAAKLASKHKLTSKQVANHLINDKIDIEGVLPAGLIKKIAESAKVEEVDGVELNKIITSVLMANEKAVSDYKSGKQTVIMFLLGSVMRQIGKKVDAQHVKSLLIAALNG